MSCAARLAAFGGAYVGASSPTPSRSRRVAHVSAVGRVAPTTASFRRMSRFRLHAEDKPWWDDAPLPSRMKNAAREIEFFGGSPLQRVLPWMSKPKATPPGRPDPKDSDALILFDFTDASSDADVDRFQRVWGELNDVVMGGSSEAFATVITIPEDEGGKCVKLSGVVEGEGGGFCSMRTRDFVTPLDLEGYAGVRVRVRGDGRRYKLILRDTDDFFALSWHAAFDTVEGRWVDVDFPFDDFVPVLRAETVREGTSEYRDLKTSRVYSLQLMFSKYEYGVRDLNPTFASGPFALEVGGIRAFKTPKVKEAAIVESAREGGDESSR